MRTKINKVKKALNEGRLAIGTWVQMASPEIVEAVGYQGYDFVIIDMEHGQFGIDLAVNMIRAAEAADVTPIVRVPDKNESVILKVLDAGASGVLVPGISSKEDALKVMEAAKYAPIGIRGACPWTRATQYNTADWEEHARWSNEETMVWLLVEGKEGVENFDDILTVPNIDVILLGPFDLSQSLGIPGQLNHPKLHDVLYHLFNKATKKNIAVAAALLSEVTSSQIEESIKKWTQIGCKIITIGGDRAVITMGFNNFLSSALNTLNNL